MKTAVLGLLIVVLASLPAQARLGETKGECEKRYGTPHDTLSAEVSITYVKNGVWVFAKFREDRCVAISYRNTPKDSGGEPKSLSDAEVKILLAANGGIETWNMLPATNIQETRWETVAHPKKQARLNAQKTTLTVSTKEEEARAKAEKDAQEKLRLKDF